MIKGKNRHKILVLSFIISICLFNIFGCGRASMEGEDTPVVEVDQEVPGTSDDLPDPTDEEVENPSEEEEEPPVETMEINIYGLNEDSLESEPAKASIVGTVTAEAVVQAVVENFMKNSIEIGIYSVVEENGKVIVSFKDHMAPLENVGSGVEETILNCISDSLVDNLDSCQAVIFRGEDKPYQSGHFEFGLDEVYTSE